MPQLRLRLWSQHGKICFAAFPYCLSDVDKTKVSFSRTVTVKFTHAEEVKQSFTKSMDDMNKQFCCRYLMYAYTPKYQ